MRELGDAGNARSAAAAPAQTRGRPVAALPVGKPEPFPPGTRPAHHVSLLKVRSRCLGKAVARRRACMRPVCRLAVSNGTAPLVRSGRSLTRSPSLPVRYVPDDLNIFIKPRNSFYNYMLPSEVLLVRKRIGCSSPAAVSGSPFILCMLRNRFAQNGNQIGSERCS